MHPHIPVVLRRLKPEVEADMGDALDAHLRRRRKALGLNKLEAAALMGVDQNTVIHWERGFVPHVSLYPTIIKFLEYEPWAEPVALGDVLLAERRKRGLSAKAMALAAGFDEGTYTRLENGQQCLVRTKTRIAAFLDQLP